MGWREGKIIDLLSLPAALPLIYLNKYINYMEEPKGGTLYPPAEDGGRSRGGNFG